MRKFPYAATAALALGLAVAASSTVSAQSSAPHKKVFGYMDEATGTFHKLSGVTPETTAAPSTGEIELIVNITLKTPLPTGGSILCDSIVDATSTNLTSLEPGALYIEDAAKTATVSGSTATCTVLIPYSWVFPAASATVTNVYDGSYDVTMFSGTSVSSLSLRSSSGSYASAVKVPAAGTTTKYTISVTL